MTFVDIYIYIYIFAFFVDCCPLEATHTRTTKRGSNQYLKHFSKSDLRGFIFAFFVDCFPWKATHTHTNNKNMKTIQRYSDTTIQRYNSTTIQRYNDAMIQRYNDTTIDNDTTIQRYNDTIYDVGTEILKRSRFFTKMLFSFCKSIIPQEIKSARHSPSSGSIKTKFKTIKKSDILGFAGGVFIDLCPGGQLNHEALQTKIINAYAEYMHRIQT